MVIDERIDVCLNCPLERCDTGTCAVFETGHSKGNVENVVYEKRKRGKPPKIYRAYGEAHTLKEWSEISHIPITTLRGRMYKYSMTLKQALIGYKHHAEK